MRIEFDFTVDDAVDFNRRAMARSQTVRALRSREIWTTALVSAVGFFIAILVISGGLRADASIPIALSVSLGFALVFGAIVFFGYRWLYDWIVTSRIKRIVLEQQFTRADSLHCEIEPRPAELWARSDSVEMTFRWEDVEEVIDTQDAIEVRFRAGLVVARNRGFISPAERAEFLSIAEGALAKSESKK